MNHEIRFDVPPQLNDKINALVDDLGFLKADLCRALFNFGLEQYNKGIVEGRTPLFIPLPDKIKQIKFERKK